MKALLRLTSLIVLSVVLFERFVAAQVETTCTWVYWNGNSEVVSPLRGLTDITDCINALAITLLLTEPNRHQSVYNGTFNLKDKEGMPITYCDSRTLKPMSDTEVKELRGWLNGNRKALSDKSYLQTLLGSNWQMLIRSHMEVGDCMKFPF